MVCLQLAGGKVYNEKAAETSSTLLKYQIKSIKITLFIQPTLSKKQMYFVK